MKKRNYWKEFCLLFIGIFIGIGIERHAPFPGKKAITIDIKRDTIVNRDTLYVKQTIVPLNERSVLAELKRQNIPCYEIVLAQSKLETGSYKSLACRNKNNLFGIRKGNTYKSYNTWKDCITDYKRLFSNKYKGGDYYEYLRSRNYASDPEYINKLKEMV